MINKYDELKSELLALQRGEVSEICQRKDDEKYVRTALNRIQKLDHLIELLNQLRKFDRKNE